MRRPLAVFGIVVAVLFVLRIALAYVTVPLGVAQVGSVLISILFVAAPILALFAAAEYGWTAKSAGLAVAIGVGLHAGGVLLHAGGVLLAKALGESGFVAVTLLSAGQAGLMIWCLGLGALLMSLIKDKNLLVPVAIFLAGLDMFLVFSPTGPTKVLVETRPELFQSVAMSVPKVVATAPEAPRGVMAAMAYVGPADLFFLAMFFVALFRFQMRTRQTLAWIIPVLALYLLVVLIAGDVQLGPVSLRALPALLPIGLTVLLVNAREFQMTRSEKLSTLFAAGLAVGVAALGLILAQRAALKPKGQLVASRKDSSLRLRRNRASQLLQDRQRRLGQGPKIDPGRNAGALEEVDHVFRGDISAGTGRIGASAETTRAGIEGHDALFERFGHVGDRGPTGVMKVVGQLGFRDMRDQEAGQGAYFGRRCDTQRVADTDFVAAECGETGGDPHGFAREDAPLQRALEGGADVAANPPIRLHGSERRDHILKDGEGLVDRHVDVLTSERIARGGENGDSADTHLERALQALGVGNQGGEEWLVGERGCLTALAFPGLDGGIGRWNRHRSGTEFPREFGERRPELRSVSELGNPLGRHKARDLDLAESRFEKRANESKLRCRRDRCGFVLQAIARTDLDDPNHKPQATPGNLSA